MGWPGVKLKLLIKERGVYTPLKGQFSPEDKKKGVYFRLRGYKNLQESNPEQGRPEEDCGEREKPRDIRGGLG